MQNPKKKNKLTAGFLSVVVPGIGHLYLGLNRQGLQFMVVFFAAVFLHLPFTAVIVPIVWFYALFDVLQKTERYNDWVASVGSTREHSEPLTEPLPATAAEVLDDRFWFDWRPRQNANVSFWLGLGIVAIGAYILLASLVPSFSRWLSDLHAGSFLVAVVLIGFGLRMIRSQRRSGKGD